MAVVASCLKCTAYLVVAVAVLVSMLAKYGVINLDRLDVPVETKPQHKDVVLTKEKLSKHDGSDPNLPIYLGFLGKVFDVSSGKRHYGKGGSYAFFSGKDATRAYVSGDFTPKGLTDAIEDLPVERYSDFNQWLELYSTQYIYVGKLQGTFYNADGSATDKLEAALVKIEQAKVLKQGEAMVKREFPECNVEWTPETGSRVWCSDKSGGIYRNWIGVPRKLFTPGQKNFRCACVSKEKLGDGRLHKYPGCHDDASECKLESE